MGQNGSNLCPGEKLGSGQSSSNLSSFHYSFVTSLISVFGRNECLPFCFWTTMILDSISKFNLVKQWIKLIMRNASYLVFVASERNRTDADVYFVFYGSPSPFSSNPLCKSFPLISNCSQVHTDKIPSFTTATSLSNYCTCICVCLKRNKYKWILHLFSVIC